MWLGVPLCKLYKLCKLVCKKLLKRMCACKCHGFVDLWNCRCVDLKIIILMFAKMFTQKFDKENFLVIDIFNKKINILPILSSLLNKFNDILITNIKQCIRAFC